MPYDREAGGAAGGCCAMAAVPSASTQLIPSAMNKRVRMLLSPAGSWVAAS